MRSFLFILIIFSCFLNVSGQNVANTDKLRTTGGAGLTGYTDSLERYINLFKNYYPGNNYEFKGFIWYQGEADMQNLTMANNYQANLGNLVTSISAVTRSDLPVYICRPNPASEGYTYFTTVRTAMANYVAGDPLSNLIDLDDIYATLHQDAAEYKLTGERLATLILTQ